MKADCEFFLEMKTDRLLEFLPPYFKQIIWAFHIGAHIINLGTGKK